jgi:hypothetical protein
MTFLVARLAAAGIAAMVAPNEFWLNLHRLSNSLEAEGDNSDERLQNIVEQFREMPHIAQWEVVSDLVRLITYLPDVYPRVMVAANQPEAGGGEGKTLKSA